MMVKLLLSPLINGYGYSPNSENVSIALDGGAPRTRRDIIGLYGDVKCNFILNNDQYNYFMAFYRTGINNGADSFTIDLKTEDAFLEEHEVFIKENSLKLTQQRADLFYVSMDLEVKPITRSAEEDETLIDLYEAYGADYPVFLNILETFVNIDMPNAL